LEVGDLEDKALTIHGLKVFDELGFGGKDIDFGIAEAFAEVVNEGNGTFCGGGDKIFVGVAKEVYGGRFGNEYGGFQGCAIHFSEDEFVF
jgi:hypothetical protein